MLRKILRKHSDSEKCKSNLKLAMARIKLLINKSENRVIILRREIAKLLQAKRNAEALLKVEDAMIESKTILALQLISLYCEVIVSKIQLMGSEKRCPDELKEAVSGIIFSSARCPDVPELMFVSTQLGVRYGSEFTNSIKNFTPDCGVSTALVQKLSTEKPRNEAKVAALNSIATEHGVTWEPSSFEEHLMLPMEHEYLSGPKTFEEAASRLQEDWDTSKLCSQKVTNLQTAATSDEPILLESSVEGDSMEIPDLNTIAKVAATAAEFANLTSVNCKYGGDEYEFQHVSIPHPRQYQLPQKDSDEDQKSHVLIAAYEDRTSHAYEEDQTLHASHASEEVHAYEVDQTLNVTEDTTPGDDELGNILCTLRRAWKSDCSS